MMHVCHNLGTFKGEQKVPRPPSFIIYRLPKLASSFLHKMPKNFFYFWQIYPNKFSPIMTIKATERPI